MFCSAGARKPKGMLEIYDVGTTVPADQDTLHITDSASMVTLCDRAVSSRLPYVRHLGEDAVICHTCEIRSGRKKPKSRLGVE